MLVDTSLQSLLRAAQVGDIVGISSLNLQNWPIKIVFVDDQERNLRVEN